MLFFLMSEDGGDGRDTVEALYDAYRDMVAAIIRRTLGGDAPLDDLVQEVFLCVIRYKDKFVGMPAAYQRNLLAVMTRNVCYNYQRKTARRSAESVEELLRESEEGGGALPPALVTDEDALGILMKKENRAILREAVERMGSPRREMLILKYAAGMKNTEIAALCHMNVNTVGTVLYRALRELKQELEERIDDEHL